MTRGRPRAGPVRRPAHGFGDDAETRRLLRSRPPVEALEWVRSLVGGTVAGVVAIRGGTSSAMHKVVLRGAGAGTRSVVLRRYVRREVLAEEPDVAVREARTLEFVERIPICTPELLGLDPTGSEAGVPAVLMTRVGGRLDWDPSDMDGWLRQLVGVLPEIHSVRPPEGFGRFFPYRPVRFEPPPWSENRRVWERAFEVFSGPAPVSDERFVHRDFHPGNVLWRRAKVSGVVDWQAACLGPPAVDVGHCRTNLFRYGLEVADRFSQMWEETTGRVYDPWSEVVSIVGVLDAHGRDPGHEGPVIEHALARAISGVA